MVKMNFATMACLALASATASQATAALVFQVGSVTFNTPIVGTQSFSLTVNAAASGQDESLTSYQLPFDVDPDGTGLPAGLTLLGATRIAETNFGFSTNETDDEDLLVTHLAADVSIENGSSADLFTLDFEITSAMAAGTYAVDLNENNGGFYSANGPSSLGTPIDGSITVAGSSVPEPGSLVLMTLAGTGALATGIWRRRRKQRSLACQHHCA